MHFSLPSIKCSAAPPSYRARGYQILEHSSDNETVLSSSRKLGGAAEHLKGAVLANQKQLLLFS